MSIATYDNLSYKTDDTCFIWHINNGKSEPYPRELDLVKKYLLQYPNNNNTFIDIGGHIGTTSLPYSRLFTNVIAYEPNKHTYDFFIENIKLNNITNVTVFNKGVYNKKTVCNILMHEGNNSGCYYIKEYTDINSISSTNLINLIKLDDEEYIKNEKINNNEIKIDFIKIDIEGAELYALEGAYDIIRKWHPLIQVETNYCSDKYFGYNKNNIFSFLISLGYKVFDDNNSNPMFYYPH